MKKRLDKKTLNQISERLLIPRSMGADAVDEIVANPDLFAGVTQRIAANQSAASAVAPKTRRPVLAGGLFSLVVLFIAAIAGLNLFNPASPKKPNAEMASTKTLEMRLEAAGPEILPQLITDKTSASRAGKNEFRGEKAGVVTRRPIEHRAKDSKGDRSERSFFPVAYTGDPAETAGGGHVIRVELNRSSLFALGVNLPLENDAGLVRADLLVGRDGVTRGVRIVD